MLDRHAAVASCYEIPGQTWPSELCWLYDSLQSSKVHAEIGVYCGRSLFASCSAIRGGTIYAVDFETPSYTQLLPSIQWLKDVRTSSLQAIRSTNPDNIIRFCGEGSLATARILQSQGVTLDSLFIDGSHEYEHVQADIQAWLPLVRSGGLISGHDYWTADLGVMRAVNEFFPDRFQIVPNTRIWYARA